MKKNKPNKLVNEKSPYLLQHAYNPVNWFPWNEEAFELAKKENKPIFLSIGYSTCHWCHVMAHESFEDEQVAALMNEVFVSIKVDREERPDIDNIYMTVCQMMTGQGGWPLTIIMDHDKKPFFSGTYFPKESRYGRIGFIDLISQIDEAWKTKRDQISSSAESIKESLINYTKEHTKEEITPSIFEKAYLIFSKRFDPKFGGFGNAPKFPSPHNLLFLLQFYQNSRNENALIFVEKTLTEMRKGGIYDHIGFGFHRYSTDQKWLLPHFEKMLYDQAMLLLAYSELYSITKNDHYKKTATEIIDYVLRDMTDVNGGFYAAEDADSDGEEGKFYVWSEEELKSILNENDFKIIKKVYNTFPDGNFTEESTREHTGTNILHLQKDVTLLAKELNMSKNELEIKLEETRKILFNIRENRIHPYKDDKILTDWNGLFVAALAIAGRLLNNDNAINAAEKCIHFIFENLFDKNQNLLHRFRENESSINANLDDFAFVIFGLIELYKTTFKIDYLEKAISFQKKQDDLFLDKESGHYFFSQKNSELIVRIKDIYDNAIPSGNSVSLINLISLAKLTGDSDFNKKADSLFSAYGETVNKIPNGFGMFLCGADFIINSTKELVVVAKSKEELNIALKSIFEKSSKNLFVIAFTEDEKEIISSVISWIKDYSLINEKTTFYLCSNFTCEKPTNNLLDLAFM